MFVKEKTNKSYLQLGLQNGTYFSDIFSGFENSASPLYFAIVANRKLYK